MLRINKLYIAHAPAATNARKSPIGLSFRIKLPLKMTNATPSNEINEPPTMGLVALISFEKAIPRNKVSRGALHTMNATLFTNEYWMAVFSAQK